MKERNAHLSFLFTGFPEAAAVQQRLTVSVALVKSNLPALKVRQYKIRVKLRRKKSAWPLLYILAPSPSETITS